MTTSSGKEKKNILPALREFILVFHIKKYTKKICVDFTLIYVYSFTRNEKKERSFMRHRPYPETVPW